ncbi:SPOR domain-containing protein [Alkalilacustris brevis]|uniref:SPOR domain-containing protein n=1 Tax=Alkalilacustris brevis TaxID=2026338 RepID=UPI000E0DDD97|nr:SPOR domain-containing protein [Alkalilacustris brevis]
MTDRQSYAYADENATRVPTAGSRLRSIANGFGAVLSVALVAGMGFWGYKLAVRDVSGVPVVRALEGPARVAPEDPGGMQAAYQGLAVNTIAAEGEAAPLPEQIVLAPPPLDLDLSGMESAPGGDASQESPAGNRLAGLTEVALRPDTDAAQPAESGATGSLRLVPADVPGVARSPLPPARPAGDLMAEAAAHAAISALSGSRRGAEIAPENLTPGTRLVQLGAFDDADAARAEWDRLNRRYSALLEGRSRVIQSAESGGRTFYRLRAHGFSDEDDARRFCSVLLAEQASCIPVLIR